MPGHMEDPMAKKANQARLLIGTTGYRHETWTGPFYPEELDEDEWLGYYAERFDTLELDTTFYRLPPPALIDAWREGTPARFLFAMRGNKIITHNRMLVGCAEELSRFRMAATRLGKKLGPILWQLPPAMELELSRLARFLRVVTQTFRTRHAVEFRHPRWHTAGTYKLLNRLGVAMVFTDVRRATIDSPLTADFVYCRRYGPGGSYGKPYTFRALRVEAERIAGWRAEGRDVYVYFHNVHEGYAVRNARMLRELCGQVPSPAEKPQNATE